jgi:hypothetical protein
MCTVTFVPVNDGILITSSRDENPMRAKAIPPASYSHGSYALHYPKDPVGGGSWIVTNNFGSTGVLLNGAQEKHAHMPPYAMSRGQILTSLMCNLSPQAAFLNLELNRIEPFTIVLHQSMALFQLMWDGKEATVKPFNYTQPHIWSSSTLYNAQQRAERKKWFDHTAINCQPDAINFHLRNPDDNEEYGIKMKRNNLLQTLSVSSLHITSSQCTFQYMELLQPVHTYISQQHFQAPQPNQNV